MNENSNPDVKPMVDAGHELPALPQGAEADELRQVKAERDALVDRLPRLQAEFDNARKRADREQQEFRAFALADALKQLLPVLDSFERAVRAPAQNLEEFRSGVELIEKQLRDALHRLGLRPVPTQGERFDPLLHHAVEMVDSTLADDDQVVEELQRGYQLGNRLLRPAMVKVARRRQNNAA